MGVRILIVDDNPRIQEDYARVLRTESRDASLDALEAELFGLSAPAGESSMPEYELAFASQGEEALKMAQQAIDEGRPYRMAFCDVRMPPGMDGVQTSQALWAMDPDLQIVLCTAFSDYTWEETLEACGKNDRLLVLKKPFDPIEVQQMAASLTAKRDLLDAQKNVQERLEELVRVRTAELEAEMKERQRVEVQLRHAQKMEALGQLAAGVAHEINTPIQFMGDAADFLASSIEELAGALADYRELVAEVAPASIEQGKAIEARHDLAFILEEAPGAANTTLEGLRTVADTVRALRSFVCEGQGDGLAPADLNDAIRTTLAVCAAQWRPVADVEVDAGDLPEVMCRVQDVNQALLQLVSNAVHAIEDAGRGRGHIRLVSRLEGDAVAVRVHDDGCGIPEEVRPKVFEPFFTTKQEGRGSGQGLTLVHNVVVEGHGGAVHLDSSPAGTVVELRLPVRGCA